MSMKKINLWLFLSILLFTSCLNELDNYDSPNGGIKGQILDIETGEPIPLPVQGSTGVIVNMFEQNTTATKTVDFYAKMDGSFEQSKLFNCDYKILIKGPFISQCEEFVTVKGQTSLNLRALPYSRISATASATDKIVTIKYKVSSTLPENSVSEVYAYWNFAPGVDNGSAKQAGKQMLDLTDGIAVFDL